MWTLGYAAQWNRTGTRQMNYLRLIFTLSHRDSVQSTGRVEGVFFMRYTYLYIRSRMISQMLPKFITLSCYEWVCYLDHTVLPCFSLHRRKLTVSASPSHSSQVEDQSVSFVASFGKSGSIWDLICPWARKCLSLDVYVFTCQCTYVRQGGTTISW